MVREVKQKIDIMVKLTDVRCSKMNAAHFELNQKFLTRLEMTRKLLMEAVQIDKVCCCFKSPIVDCTGITLKGWWSQLR